MPHLPDDDQKILETATKVNHSFSENDFKHHLHILDLFRLSLRAFKSRSLRAILTTLGIGVGIGAVMFLVSLGFGMQKILIEQIAKTEDSLFSIEAYFPAESNLHMTEKDLQEIKKINGVAEISPSAEFSGEMNCEGISGLLSIKIVESNYFRLAGKIPEIGEIFQEGEAAAIVSSAALKLFGLEPNESVIGKELKIKLFRPDEFEINRPLKIKGVIGDDIDPPYVFVPRSALAGVPLDYQSVMVRAESADFVFVIRDILLDRGTFISAKLDLINQANKILNIATIILGVFGATALIVSAIGMFNTMTIALLERTYEIGIMKSLGATDLDIKKLFLTEAFLTGFFGGIAGLLIGFGSADALNFGMNMLAKSFKGKPLDLFVRPLWFMISLVGFSSFVSLFTGYWPARRAVKLSPREAFKKQ
ncbi:MAG: ABC transporter permease [Patescibacteria group bacterium]|nr:ABC transporter permease [Patescibacteria group bacterium]